MPRDPGSAAARAFASELARSGVREVVVSPGSRSTPLVLAFVRLDGVRRFVATDERSAGFFALGMARELGRPVALLSTSGTAAANYLPAVVEASLSRVPLVVVTADRPPELRDCHAAQTIDQVGLFGRHARWAVDAPRPEGGRALRWYERLAARVAGIARGPLAGPVHVNFPFDEPLFDVEETIVEDAEATDDGPVCRVVGAEEMPDPGAIAGLARELGAIERGVVVAGPFATRDVPEREPIVRLAEVLGWPILADPLSGLRFGSHDRSLVVCAHDLLLRDPELADELRPEVALRIGLPPTSKTLARFLDDDRVARQVIAAEAHSWPDPDARATDVVRASGARFAASLAEALGGRRVGPWADRWVGRSRDARRALAAGFSDEPPFLEGGVAARVFDAIPEGSLLFVGSSMPVRDVDLFVGTSGRSIDVVGNRGANGIDGVPSAAAGAAAAGRRPVTLLVGDLSFLHDGGAADLVRRNAVTLVSVVVHNDGGGIFHHLPQARLDGIFERYFGTPHGVPLESLSALAGARHELPATWAELDRALEEAWTRSGPTVVEVRTDRHRNPERTRRLVERTLRARLTKEDLHADRMEDVS